MPALQAFSPLTSHEENYKPGCKAGPCPRFSGNTASHLSFPKVSLFKGPLSPSSKAALIHVMKKGVPQSGKEVGSDGESAAARWGQLGSDLPSESTVLMC